MDEFYQHNRADQGMVGNDVGGNNFVSRVVEHVWSAAQAVAAAAAAVRAAVADNGAAQQIRSGFVAMPGPRNVTATVTGTAADVKAVSVIVYGKRYGVTISETLPAFTENTLGTVTGSKIFDEVTGFDTPAHDGTGVSTSIGTGSRLGLPFRLLRNSVLAAYLGNARESTAPTVAVNASALESNSVQLNSALNGSEVRVQLVLP